MQASTPTISLSSSPQAAGPQIRLASRAAPGAALVGVVLACQRVYAHPHALLRTIGTLAAAGAAAAAAGFAAGVGATQLRP